MRSSITISLVPEARQGPFVFHGDWRWAVQFAANVGFHAVEVFPRSADSLPISDLKEMTHELGLQVSAVGTGAGWLVERRTLADPNQARRTEAIDFVRRIIDAAAELQAPAIVGSMQGRSSAESPPDRSRGLLRESLESLDRHAADSQGHLLYEPLNRYETDQCNTLAQGLDLIRGLNRTQLLADWFHMNIEEVSLVEAIQSAGSAIGHVHFADTNRHAVGFGHLDPKPLIETLRRIGYSGYLSAEVFPHPTSEAAAQRTADAFQQLLSQT
jgi:sugar phosphate isomerase/epimerase